tara:strand:+ start:451 stop:552 length:102 start_codon:yes stop_codon:yes gene_type:complete
MWSLRFYNMLAQRSWAGYLSVMFSRKYIFFQKI